ncbi:MAG: cysteine desulfurase [Candidatus Vogelbacteria bacterium]|nr:cysteine desulfurase [Candidatus Vogelbacteria bacterium]
MRKRIYMDYAAATPVDPRVLEAMAPYWIERAANPHSIHSDGLAAREGVEYAHVEVARVLGCTSSEIIFTASATEANNIVMQGLPKQGHIIVSAFEHPSITNTLPLLEKRGFAVTKLSPNQAGEISPDAVRAALREDTVLVSLIHSHNEIGTIQPLANISRVIREHRGNSAYPYFHTDACQSPTTLSIMPQALGVDLMTINSAKVYGPKGVGALYMKKGVLLSPLVYGGGQERGMRSGTENVPGIVGFAYALQLVQTRRDDERKRLTLLRDRLIAGILDHVPDAELNGSATERLANNVNFSLQRTLNEQAVIELDMMGISSSSGGACESGAEGGSYAVRALGKDKTYTTSAVRFTLGVHSTEQDIDEVIAILPRIIEKLRAQSDN